MKKFEPYYSRKKWKAVTPLAGRIGCKLGIIHYYLDYQLWKPHIRWWHPVSILILIIMFIPVGIMGSIDLVKGTTLPKRKRIYHLKNARE